MYPKKIEDLIESLQIISGVGQKTAERYALELLKKDSDTINDLSKAILGIKEIKTCSICGNYCENKKCYICEDDTRDKKTIMVVSEARDILAFEKNNSYNGVYHVLGGEISPANGVMPEDLNIEGLLERVEKDEIQEVIISTNLTIDGETTAMYLSKKLANYSIEVSRIANGIPMGGHIDYADEITLSKAIEDRKKIKND